MIQTSNDELHLAHFEANDGQGAQQDSKTAVVARYKNKLMTITTKKK
jgi:hypothetical protein